MNIDDILKDEVKNHKYPLLFATISGAHLYGFPSPDSDFDLRGAHILPPNEVMGLYPQDETIEFLGDRKDIEMDLVTHDIKKFFNLMLKKNGYVLEQLHSPHIVHTTPEHEELKEIAKGCITKFHFHHYSGFFRNQWKMIEKESPPRAKPLLYAYRVLLTGIHMMQTGEVKANLVILNEKFKLPFIDELIDLKINGHEKSTVSIDLKFHRMETDKLQAQMEEASKKSALPENHTCKDSLNDLLLRIRKFTM